MHWSGQRLSHVILTARFLQLHLRKAWGLQLVALLVFLKIDYGGLEAATRPNPGRKDPLREI